MKRIRNQGGFATVTVVFLSLISIVGGAFLLQRMRGLAAASSGYYQAHVASLAAQAGLESGIAQLESDPVGGLAILNAYLADTTRKWLLGESRTGARNVLNMDNNLQQYSARIVAFDPQTRLIKVEGMGKGPQGSAASAFGVYHLGGLSLVTPVLAKYAWYLAGEGRNVDQQVDVWGDTYFGGGVHFNGGANGSVLHGTVKVARGVGLESSFDANIVFSRNAYFQTPFRGQGTGLRFCMSVGFEAPLFIETEPALRPPGGTAYFNDNITGGNADFDMGGFDVRHSGSLDLSRIRAAGRITNNGRAIDIAGAMGMQSGGEQELRVDLGGVPAGKRFTPASLGLGAWGDVTGAELTNAYNAAKAAGKLYRDYLFLDVNGPFNLVPAPAPNLLKGKFVFEVTTQVNVNGNLPESDPASVSLWHVGPGASINGFGGSGLFRGYVNVSGDGSVIYQWAPGCEFEGAIHHVSPATGFQLNTSAGPLKMIFNPGVFEELAPLQILIPSGGLPPAPAAVLKLVDVKIRPLLRSRYF